MTNFHEGRAGLAKTVKEEPENQKNKLKNDPLDSFLKGDLIYLLINNIICRKLIGDLEGKQRQFVEENSHKHRKVLWINILVSVLVYHGVSDVPVEEMSTVVNSLMAPAFITGGAWFAISFGGVPGKLLDRAVDITFWMFSAFTISLTTMAITLYFVANIYLSIVFGLIISGVIISSILYDNIDGLKVGLDEALLKGNLANIEYLLKNNLIDSVPKDIDNIKKRYGTNKIED